MAVNQEVASRALLRAAERANAEASVLNELDGRLGDGDLGATLSKCALQLREALKQPHADLGAMLMACAIACARASGSSFGTLLSVAFLDVAKQCKGRQDIAWREIGPVLASALQAMAARGGAALGDKTVLDALAAVTAAIDGLDEPAAIGAAATRASAQALVQFRGQPNRIGRARMFAERSKGLDDPGMVAFSFIVQACADVAQDADSQIKDKQA